MTFGDNEFADLERQLRAQRTEPNESLQRRVTDLASPPQTSRTFRAVRLAVTGALTLAVIVTAAVLTTTGNAGNGGTRQHDGGAAANLQLAAGSASASQYQEKVIICHRTWAGDRGVTLRLSPRAAKYHLAQHPFDTLGPCP